MEQVSTLSFIKLNIFFIHLIYTTACHFCPYIVARVDNPSLLIHTRVRTHKLVSKLPQADRERALENVSMSCRLKTRIHQI